MASICDVRIHINNFSKCTRPRDMLFLFKDTLSRMKHCSRHADLFVHLFPRAIISEVLKPKVWKFQQFITIFSLTIAGISCLTWAPWICIWSSSENYDQISRNFLSKSKYWGLFHGDIYHSLIDILIEMYISWFTKISLALVITALNCRLFNYFSSFSANIPIGRHPILCHSVSVSSVKSSDFSIVPVSSLHLYFTFTVL